jgi:hypothetical protein
LRHGSSTTTLNDVTAHSEDYRPPADCDQRGGWVHLGYDAKLSINDIEQDSRKIIIGSHLLKCHSIEQMPSSTIIVNTERIHENQNPGWHPVIFKWVGRFETWDFKPRNIEVFESMGIAGVKLMGIGYQPQLSRIGKADEQDIDVLFYGSRSRRRNAVLQQMRQRGLRVVSLFGVYGAERDEYVARAKVVVSPHKADSEIFEVLRVNYLLSNAKAVVCEVDSLAPIPDNYRDGFVGVPYDSLADECERLARDPSDRATLEDRALATISRCPQTDFLRELLV